jgi:hypothetical protein
VWTNKRFITILFVRLCFCFAQKRNFFTYASQTSFIFISFNSTHPDGAIWNFKFTVFGKSNCSRTEQTGLQSDRLKNVVNKRRSVYCGRGSSRRLLLSLKCSLGPNWFDVHKLSLTKNVLFEKVIIEFMACSRNALRCKMSKKKQDTQFQESRFVHRGRQRTQPTIVLLEILKSEGTRVRLARHF